MSTNSEQRRDRLQPLDEFVAALPPGARLIGIDVGTKTLGLALSDATRTIASSLVTLRRSRLSNSSFAAKNNQPSRRELKLPFSGFCRNFSFCF